MTAEPRSPTATAARPIEDAWPRLEADEIGEALVQAARLRGVERIWYVSGSELAFLQEAVAKNAELGRPTPQLMSMLHESVALAAAMGDTMVTGAPSVAAAHVDVGLLNMGGGIHNALRGEFPVAIMTGYPPVSSAGSGQRLARFVPAFWGQQLWDNGQIVRQYVKWDYRVTPYENPALVMSRALQVALSEPRGPVYLALPPEAIFAPPPQPLAIPPDDQWGVPSLGDGDEMSVRETARWLVEAANPLVLVERLGRRPDWVTSLVRLAELLALPVAGSLHRVNFPQTHPLWEAGPRPAEADVLLVLDHQTPWFPGANGPSAGARIIRVGNDPNEERIPLYEYPAHLRVQADSGPFLDRVAAAAEGLLTRARRSAIQARRERLAAAGELRRASREEAARADGAKSIITRAWLAWCLGQVVRPDDVVVNEFGTTTFLARSEPGTCFQSGGSSLGWGGGAALGGKVARPDRRVVYLAGDGTYNLSIASAWLWGAHQLAAPFLTVIFNNRGFGTGTTNLKLQYPQGTAVRIGDYHGGYIDPPPNYAGEAAASGAYGERVTEPGEVIPALRRGLEAVERQGVPAVIDVWIARLLSPEDAPFRG